MSHYGPITSMSHLLTRLFTKCAFCPPEDEEGAPGASLLAGHAHPPDEEAMVPVSCPPLVAEVEVAEQPEQREVTAPHAQRNPTPPPTTPPKGAWEGEARARRASEEGRTGRGNSVDGGQQVTSLAAYNSLVGGADPTSLGTKLDLSLYNTETCSFCVQITAQHMPTAVKQS